MHKDNPVPALPCQLAILAQRALLQAQRARHLRAMPRHLIGKRHPMHQSRQECKDQRTGCMRLRATCERWRLMPSVIHLAPCKHRQGQCRRATTRPRTQMCSTCILPSGLPARVGTSNQDGRSPGLRSLGLFAFPDRRDPVAVEGPDRLQLRGQHRDWGHSPAPVSLFSRDYGHHHTQPIDAVRQAQS